MSESPAAGTGTEAGTETARPTHSPAEGLRRPRGAERRTSPTTPATPVPEARPTGTPASGMTGPLRQILGPVTGSLKLLARSDAATEQTLRVDWPQCKAHGLCAEIAPEVIHLDEWGYPVVDGDRLTGEVLTTVRKAVQACPTLALKLTDVTPH